jgi:hypothetical protein
MGLQELELNALETNDIFKIRRKYPNGQVMKAGVNAAPYLL